MTDNLQALFDRTEAAGIRFATEVFNTGTYPLASAGLPDWIGTVMDCAQDAALFLQSVGLLEQHGENETWWRWVSDKKNSESICEHNYSAMNSYSACTICNEPRPYLKK